MRLHHLRYQILLLIIQKMNFECYNNLGLYFLKQEEYEKALKMQTSNFN